MNTYELTDEILSAANVPRDLVTIAEDDRRARTELRRLRVLLDQLEHELR